MDNFPGGLNRGMGGEMAGGVMPMNADTIKKKRKMLRYEEIVKRLGQIPGASGGFVMNENMDLPQMDNLLKTLEEYLSINEDYMKARGRGIPITELQQGAAPERARPVMERPAFSQGQS